MLKSILAFGLTRRAIILLGLLVFIAAGVVAFTKLNIEAYPNPAPVILEITAQAAGLSAEEMERYYTIPMEIGLYPTPGIDNIRSTSFYGLTFVRVTFRYGVDYFFAYTQAALSLQQNVTLPGNQIPQIQQSSLVGEVYRYQVVGPPHFGLTNLRTVQDWIATRGLFTVTDGVVAVNSWGGTTKQYNVDVDLHKLDAYNVTVPQIISALGNANINVGGREITVGQQSVNIRGIGLFDSGGDEDLTQGWHVNDIENVVLGQFNGVPIQIKDVAKVSVGYVPRLGIAGMDHDSDVALSIVVMGRTFHTNDVVPRIKAEIERLNTDGELPPGVKLVPYYDRTGLVNITTRTVLHNLIFGCILVFLIQWIFLGNLRSAIIVGVNIPFALFFAVIIMVLMGQDANLLSVGAVDFGIIVDSAVILVENIFRNFQAPPEARQSLLRQLAEGRFGADPTHPVDGASRWTDRLRMILASALQVDNAIFFSALITVAAFVPSVHHAGRRRSDFQSDGANLRIGLGRRIAVDLHHYAGVGVIPASRACGGNRNHCRACAAPDLFAGPALVARSPENHAGDRHFVSRRDRLAGDAAWQRVPAGTGRRQSVDQGVYAADDGTGGGRAGDDEDARDPSSSSRSAPRRFPARPARQRQRCFAVFQRRTVRAAQAV